MVLPEQLLAFLATVSICIICALCDPSGNGLVAIKTVQKSEGAAENYRKFDGIAHPTRVPIFAKGERQFGERTTPAPHYFLPYPVPHWPFPVFIFDRIPYPTLSRGIPPYPTVSARGVPRNGPDGNALVPRPCPLCPRGMFQCRVDCECVDLTMRCDKKKDCLHGEDEKDCIEFSLEPIRHEIDKCDEKKFFLCPKTNRCILKEWLCDGEDDCGDYSDETRCDLGGQNCTENDFECGNGFCVPKMWLCDNEDDCRDFSDEAKCTSQGCGPDEFQCPSGTCISLNFKCDGHADCDDGSDEKDCDIETATCDENEFSCANTKCIKLSFKCDGDGDCEDLSDEDDCDNLDGMKCGEGEFQCKNGPCIPQRWTCDNQKDCPSEDDEVNCTRSTNATCEIDQYECSGQCIKKSWVCDTFEDCPKGEDEENCTHQCDDRYFACSGLNSNDTKPARCIKKKFVCDGQQDCPNGDDEKNCPTKQTCDNTKCQQYCVTYPNGKHGCACETGFQLNKDGISCDDINECLYATEPVCSQKCNNSIGSYSCGCMTGYVLRPDQHSCKAVGAPPTIFFANRIDIRQMSLSDSKYTSIMKGLHNAISLDFHYKKKLLFWSDVSIDKIKRAAINGSAETTVIGSGLESPGGIAVDWIHNLLYWTDSGTKRVEVTNLNGSHRAILVAHELDKPRAIVVHPGEALFFWTDWGPNPKIERAELDGSNRHSIVNESVFWPNGLTIDYVTNQLYWADAKHNVIETTKLDGSARRKIMTQKLPHPFSLAIFEDALFWTDWHTKSIATANKQTGAGYAVVHSDLHFPMGIHVYHSQRQPKYKNRCGNNNGGCEHLCLPNKKSYSCVCRMGQRLKSDKKSCQIPDKFILFARRKDIRLVHMNEPIENQHQTVIPLEGVKQAVNVAWDARRNLIFWSDLALNSINKAYWNGSDHQVIIDSNVAIEGLAFDWLTDKLYWTLTEKSRIEVSNIDGSMRSVLIWENSDKPGDIALDPLSGLMFWTDQGAYKRIESAQMNGEDRKILVYKNISQPNGLTADHATGKLYWTDGELGLISYVNYNGTARTTIFSGDMFQYPYGLDVFENRIYWTDWLNKSIQRSNKFDGSGRTTVLKYVQNVMGMKIFHQKRKYPRTPCSNGHNGGCSHLCVLRPQGHACICPTGIMLQDDGRTCSTGPTNYLIIAHRLEIRQVSLDVPYMVDVVLPLKHLKMIPTLDIDHKTGHIYFADSSEGTIQKAFPNGTDREAIINSEILGPDGLAVDSAGRKIYWTDCKRQSIEVAEMDGTNRKILFQQDLINPRAITLEYRTGFMFWSDWGKTKAKIERASMDGTNRITLVNTTLIWPNGLAVDHVENKLYWNDAYLHTIESSNFDGSSRRVILTKVEHPYGLVVVGPHIYWTDWKTMSLNRADKKTGNESLIVISGLKGLMDVRSTQNDIITENVCGTNNGGCSHLCLRNPTGYSCACPTGLSVSGEDKKSCEPVAQTFLLAAARYSLSQISLDTEDAWDVSLPIKDDMQNVIAVDFHYKKRLIFYADIGRNLIQRVDMYNLSSVDTIARSNVLSPEAIAVDWLADNIYWANTGRQLIEMAKLDGRFRKTIIWNVTDPRSIALHPKAGYMYWTDWNPLSPRIDRAYLDGTSRRTIVGSDLYYPVGLVVDFSTDRIFWINAKVGEERIECADLQGHTRVALVVDKIHPFSLTQFEEWIFWTDWNIKGIMRAEKRNGKDIIFIRPMYAALGLTMVADSRQPGWNPCAVNNGNCTHLCFFKRPNYECGCPDIPDFSCSTSPASRVSNVCPPGAGYNCPDRRTIQYGHREVNLTDHTETNIELLPTPGGPALYGEGRFYLMAFIIMSIVAIVSIGIVGYIIIQKSNKKYQYGASRSFANPNYYSNDPNNCQNHVDKKQCIWKRLKYDKNQERVYEETVVASPEVTSLIPTILTPCNANCEPVTPDMERSPSVTPLHKMEVK